MPSALSTAIDPPWASTIAFAIDNPSPVPPFRLPRSGSILENVKDLLPGDVIEAVATDPGSAPDFVAWCRATGNELLEQSEQDGVYRFVIRKTR